MPQVANKHRANVEVCAFGDEKQAEVDLFIAGDPAVQEFLYVEDDPDIWIAIPMDKVLEVISAPRTIKEQ